jgi:uncharacterized peroxidase-related enzyme
MTRIKVIQHSEATGRLKEIYDDLVKKRGQLAEVHKIQSLRPESIVKHMDLYMEIMFSKSEISRAEREMMAVVTSVSNQCFYCQIHHSNALNNYWKNDGKIEKLRKDYFEAELSEREFSLCLFAENLTLNPNELNESKIIDNLKKDGFSDAAILDATLVVSYFNFVNRMVLALGVSIEEDGGTGYKY